MHGGRLLLKQAATIEAGGHPAEEPLPGPFISYSRRDRGFAQKLYDALRAGGRDAWVDLEGIEPSEEWLRKLHAAIDAAQAFVFVISPDSVSSRHCEDEIRYATESNKKLIPVLWREVDPDRLPPALARIQWISFVDEVHFDDAVADLVRAVDTDLEWNARHTRLLVRAREWTNAAHDRSLLLRGKDLKEAEQWLLDSSAIRDRQPAALHTELIGASVKAEKRFRNRLLSSVTGAAGLAITLAVVAVFQRNLAQENEQQALSRQLAAQAQGIVDRDLGLSMLLAVTAFQRRPTFEATRAMFTAMHHRPHLRTYLHGQSSRVHQLAFDAQGKLLASSATDGRVVVWDVATARPLFALQEGGRAPAIAVHSASRVLATSGDSGNVHLWHLDRGDSLATLAVATGAPAYRLAFSPDGHRLAAGAASGRVVVWNVDSRIERCSTPARTGAAIAALRFDSSGERVAALDHAGGFRLLELAACIARDSGGTPASADVAALSADLSTAISATPGPPELLVFDLDTGTSALHKIDGATGYVLGLDIHPDGNTFAVGTQVGEVLLWNVGQRRTTRTLRGHTEDVTALAFDATGGLLASGSITGAVIVYDLARPSPIQPVRTLPANAVNIAFTADGQHLLAVDASGAASFWAVASLQRTDQLPPWPSGRTVAVSVATERVATLAHAGIEVRNWRTGALVDSVRETPDGESQLAFSPDGRLLAFVAGRRVVLRDVQQRTSQVLVERQDATGAVAFSLAGDALLFAAGGDAVVSYNLRTSDTTSFRVPGGKGPVQSLAQRENLLAAGGNIYDGNVYLWDVTSGTVVRTLATRGDLMPIARLSFSADGRTLAAFAAFDEALRLWDVATGQLILGPVKLEGFVNQTTGAAFSPDGSLLATAESGGVVLRTLDPERWVDAICSSINRDLTPDEWRSYVGRYAFQPTCPAAVRNAAPSGPARPAARRPQN